ncbi:unnamed protein product [Leptidea sinapis]|uniref:Uncharacterized protein n=1 Tax=Leptidea sinapis TaxID=189913 RepID=A0A5E4R1H1_9NEOP|nr:unnamed protein product [Leptidea sinapis]
MSFQYVRIYYGPCDSFHSAIHKPQKLRGLRDIPLQHQEPVLQHVIRDGPGVSTRCGCRVGLLKQAAPGAELPLVPGAPRRPDVQTDHARAQRLLAF